MAASHAFPPGSNTTRSPIMPTPPLRSTATPPPLPSNSRQKAKPRASPRRRFAAGSLSCAAIFFASAFSTAVPGSESRTTIAATPARNGRSSRASSGVESGPAFFSACAELMQNIDELCPQPLARADFARGARRGLFHDQERFHLLHDAIIVVAHEKAIDRAGHALEAGAVVVEADDSARLKQPRPGEVLGDVVDLVRTVDEDEREAFFRPLGFLKLRPALAAAKVDRGGIKPRLRQIPPHGRELIGKIGHRVNHDEVRPRAFRIGAH